MCHNPDSPQQTPRELLLLEASAFLTNPNAGAYQQLMNLLLDEMRAAPDVYPYNLAFATLAGGEGQGLAVQQERVRSMVGLLP